MVAERLSKWGAPVKRALSGRKKRHLHCINLLFLNKEQSSIGHEQARRKQLRIGGGVNIPGGLTFQGAVA